MYRNTHVQKITVKSVRARYVDIVYQYLCNANDSYSDLSRGELARWAIEYINGFRFPKEFSDSDFMTAVVELAELEMKDRFFKSSRIEKWLRTKQATN